MSLIQQLKNFTIIAITIIVGAASNLVAGNALAPISLSESGITVFSKNSQEFNQYVLADGTITGLRYLDDFSDPNEILGNKTKSFYYFKKLGLLYPKGIRIPIPLVNALREDGNGELIEKIVYEILAIYKGEVLYVRSSPADSMPGRLHTEKNVYAVNSELKRAIMDVAQSWHGADARAYRAQSGITEESGMEIIVQLKVDSSKNSNSGSGVAYSCDPDDLCDSVSGNFCLESGAILAEGGDTEASDISLLRERFSEIYEQLRKDIARLEQALKFPVQIEYAIEDGRLYYLQVRRAKLTPQAHLQFIENALNQGMLTETEVIPLIRALHEKLAVRKMYAINSEVNKHVFGKGKASTIGAMFGKIAFDIEHAKMYNDNGEKVILVVTKDNRELIFREFTKIKDVGLILYDLGHSSSHEIDICREAGIPAIINCEKFIKIDAENKKIQSFPAGLQVSEGSFLGIDTEANEIFTVPEGDADDVLKEEGVFYDISFGLDYSKVESELFEYLERNNVNIDELYELYALLQYFLSSKMLVADKKHYYYLNVAKHLVHEHLIETIIKEKGLTREKALQIFKRNFRPFLVETYRLLRFFGNDISISSANDMFHLMILSIFTKKGDDWFFAGERISHDSYEPVHEAIYAVLEANDYPKHSREPRRISVLGDGTEVFTYEFFYVGLHKICGLLRAMRQHLQILASDYKSVDLGRKVFLNKGYAKYISTLNRAFRYLDDRIRPVIFLDYNKWEITISWGEEYRFGGEAHGNYGTAFTRVFEEVKQMCVNNMSRNQDIISKYHDTGHDLIYEFTLSFESEEECERILKLIAEKINGQLGLSNRKFRVDFKGVFVSDSSL